MLIMIAGTILYFYRRGWLKGALIAARQTAPAPTSVTSDITQVARNIVLKGDDEAVGRRAA
jgi:hypothetical protein